VTKLAANAGAVFPVPPLGHVTKTSTNRDRLTIGIVGAILIAAIAAFTLLRRRRA
jgi:hypothetical protein